MFSFFSQSQHLKEVIRGLYVTNSDVAMNERVLKVFSIKHVMTLNNCTLKDYDKEIIDDKTKHKKMTQQKIYDKLDIKHVIITNSCSQHDLVNKSMTDVSNLKNNLWIFQFHNAYQQILSISPNDKNRCMIYSEFSIDVVHAFVAYFLCKKFDMSYRQAISHLKKTISILTMPMNISEYLSTHYGEEHEHTHNGVRDKIMVHLEIGHVRNLRSALRKTTLSESTSNSNSNEYPKKTVRFAEELDHEQNEIRIDSKISQTSNDIKNYAIKNERKLKRTHRYISLPSLEFAAYESSKSRDNMFEDLMTGSLNIDKHKIKVSKRGTNFRSRNSNVKRICGIW
jgi:hypothetical protein